MRVATESQILNVRSNDESGESPQGPSTGAAQMEVQERGGARQSGAVSQTMIQSSDLSIQMEHPKWPL